MGKEARHRGFRQHGVGEKVNVTLRSLYRWERAKPSGFCLKFGHRAKEYSMNKAILVSAMGALGLAAAGAASAQEIGRVLSSTPVVQQVPVQRQVCSQPQPVVQQAPQGGGGAG